MRKFLLLVMAMAICGMSLWAESLSRSGNGVNQMNTQSRTETKFNVKDNALIQTTQAEIPSLGLAKYKKSANQHHAQSRANSLYQVSFNVVAPENASDYTLVAIALMNSYGEFEGYIDTYVEGWDFSNPLTAESVWGEEGFESGNYHVLAITIKTDNSNGLIPYGLYSAFTLDSSDATVDIDFAQCTHRLEIIAEQGNEELYPKNDEDATLSWSFVFGEEVEMGTTFWGVGQTYAYANDFPEGGYYSNSFEYMNWETMEGSKCTGLIRMPFDSDRTFNIDSSVYTLLENKTSLSPRDRELMVRSYANSNTTLTEEQITEDMSMISEISWVNMSWLDDPAEAADHLYEYLVLPISHNPNSSTWEYCLGTGFIAYADFWSGQYFNKMSGNVINTPEGIMIVGRNWGYYDNDPTYIAPVSIYNIDPQSQDIVNFYNTLYADPVFTLYGDTESGTVYYCGFDINFNGPFHEWLHYGGWEENPCIQSIQINGKEVESLDEIYNYDFNNLEVVIKAAYPDGWVADEFACEYPGEIGVNTSNPNDAKVPKISGFQVRNEDDIITPRLTPNQKGTLYISLMDEDNIGNLQTDYKCTFELAPEESEEWTEIVPIDETEYGVNIGTLYAFNLNELDLNTETWYKVKVTATDASDNYSITTLRYCFAFTESSGINDVSISAEPNVEPRWFNLQGMPVVEPKSPGVYIDANTGLKVVK